MWHKDFSLHLLDRMIADLVSHQPSMSRPVKKALIRRWPDLYPTYLWRFAQRSWGFGPSTTLRLDHFVTVCEKPSLRLWDKRCQKKSWRVRMSIWRKGLHYVLGLGGTYLDGKKPELDSNSYSGKAPSMIVLAKPSTYRSTWRGINLVMEGIVLGVNYPWAP